MFSLVFYNTENFYDTFDDPDTMDDDFTPDGKLKWTQRRFSRKVRNISKVLRNVVHPDYPDIIALAEIENSFVLERLVRSDNLSKIPYKIVHFESPDERGSDVGLVYNSETFTVLHAEPILVRLEGLEDRTRDILYVKGKTRNEKELHLLVTHFPSRKEGTDKSEPRRLFVASVLNKQVDKIFKEDANANIIIMGDFNDEPDNRSIQSVIKARDPREPYVTNELYNLMYPLMKKGVGSMYHEKWMLFDQLIVSGNMMFEKSGFVCKPEFADVFNPRYLFYHDKNIKDLQPNRTYGNKYYGGYSDHLPVYLKMELKTNEA